MSGGMQDSADFGGGKDKSTGGTSEGADTAREENSSEREFLGNYM